MRVLLISGWSKLVKILADLDIEVVLFYDYDDFSSVEHLCAEYIKVDTNNYKEVLNKAKALHQKKPIDFVYSIREQDQELASKIGGALGTGCVDLEVTEKFRDKIKFREALGSIKCNIPWFQLDPSLSTNDNIKSEKYYIAKPTKGAGSKGVKKYTGHQLLSLIESNGFDLDNSVVVEEFIEGTEFSVETLSSLGKHQVLGVTTKYISGDPYFYEIAHTYPTLLPRDTMQKISDAVCQVLDRLGYVNGAAHTEVKLVNNDVFVIESNCRPAGDRISILIEQSHQIDIIKQHLITTLGLPNEKLPPCDPLSDRFTAMFFHGSGGTLVNKIEALIPQDIEIIDFGAEFEQGSSLPETIDSYTRYGCLVAATKDLESRSDFLSLVDISHQLAPA